METKFIMIRLLLLTALFSFALAARIPRGPIPMLDGRVIGGEETTIDKYPYQLSLRYMGSHRCGASIYKSNVALTAAHCVQGANKLFLRFVAGSSQRNSGGESLYVSSIVVHEQYSPQTAIADIALVFLDGNYDYSNTIQPIVLPGGSPSVGTPAVVSGWGTESEGASTIPVNLRAVGVEVVYVQDCARAYSNTPYEILDGMLCAGVVGGGKDACQGDSGGPLNVGMTQVGVVSWGWGCAQADYPGVYTDVASYVSWIKSKA